MPVSYPTTDEPYPESSPSLEYGMQTWTIETPDGVIEAQRGQHSWNYEGTLEALLAGKIAEPWQLPGHPKCKRKRGFDRDDIFRFGKRVRLSVARQRDGLIRVWVFLTDAQIAIDNAQEQQKKELRWLPDSANRFRALIRGGVTPLHSAETVAATRGGYRFPKWAVDAFFETVDEAVSELFDGRVIFDAAARRREIQGIMQKTAVADSGFQSHLASIVAGASATSDRA